MSLEQRNALVLFWGGERERECFHFMKKEREQGRLNFAMFTSAKLVKQSFNTKWIFVILKCSLLDEST